MKGTQLAKTIGAFARTSITYIYTIVDTRESTRSLWIPHKMVLQLEQFINFPQIKAYVNLKMILDKHVALYMLIYSTVSIKSQIRENNVTNLPKYSIAIARTNVA